jgi:hypothetical protein
MQRLLMLSVSAVAAIYAGSAAADALKGAYSFTGSTVCLSTAATFTTSQQANPPASISSGSDEGIRIFNGNGTGTFTDRDTSVTAPVAPVPPNQDFLPDASSSESGASFTYTVADDEFTLQNVAGTDKGTVLSGPRKGQTFTIESLPPATGLISANGRTLTTSILTPAVGTITYSNGQVFNRICARSRVYVKLDSDGAN